MVSVRMKNVNHVFMYILQFFDEVDRIHPSPNGFCHRFREGFASVLPNVLKLAMTKSPLAKHYVEARQDALAEDIPGKDSHLASEPHNNICNLLYYIAKYM